MTATGLYFEDFQVGMELTTPVRTITADDIAAFCALTGDANAVHVDAAYAAASPFGGIVAHGPLVYGIAEGLQCASGINDGTLLALLGMDDWKLRKPVKAGDTVHMEQTVAATRRTRAGDTGVVTLRRRIVNQQGETVQEMTTALLFRCRPAG